MLLVLFSVIAIVFTSVSADDWSPPENPDPQEILREARADAQAKNYETALAKHVWFHENALSIQPSMYGVRLSFALSYWGELAEEYPAALTKMKEIRDQAKKNIIDGTNVRESFHDLSALNRQLDEQAETKNVFEILDQKHPKTAKQVFDLAQPSLVRAKAYPLFAKYVSPQHDLPKIVEELKQLKKMADDERFSGGSMRIVKKQLANKVTTLVAILVVTDRKSEAEEIAKTTRAEWDDSSFHKGLDKALEGVVPDPWP